MVFLVTSNVEGKVTDHGLHIIDHVNFEDSWFAQIEVHAQIIKAFGPFGFDLAEFTVFFIQPFQKFVIDCTVNVTGPEVVHMESDCLLRVVHLAVCHTGIVGVEFEANLFEITSKHFSPKQCCN